MSHLSVFLRSATVRSSTKADIVWDHSINWRFPDGKSTRSPESLPSTPGLSKIQKFRSELQIIQEKDSCRSSVKLLGFRLKA